MNKRRYYSPTQLLIIASGTLLALGLGTENAPTIIAAWTIVAALALLMEMKNHE